MAIRNFLRYLLLTPVQISVFLLISLPLALFAAVTTFFSVIFLSSRLLLVYVDLVVSVVFASPSSSPAATKNTSGGEGIKLNTPNSPHSRRPHPLMIPRSPPSPPRSGSSGWRSQQQKGGYYHQSFTAPSSPNIGRKRMALSGAFYQQSTQPPQAAMPSASSSGGSSPLVMKGGSGKQVGGNSSISPPHGYEGTSNGRGKKGPVVVVEPGEEDYFTRGPEQ